MFTCYFVWKYQQPQTVSGHKLQNTSLYTQFYTSLQQNHSSLVKQ